jgi:hypothetical protein
MKLVRELFEKVEDKGYFVAVTHGGDGVKFPHFYIEIDQETMIGISKNSIVSAKQFRIFPYGTDVTIEEILDMLPEKGIAEGDFGELYRDFDLGELDEY